MAKTLKRPCRCCGTTDVVVERWVTEPNEVSWRINEAGFEEEIVHSTHRVRYTHCTECNTHFDA